MAEPLISRVYSIEIAGFEDSAKNLQSLTKEFKKLDAVKKKLNKELKEKVQVDDSAAIKALQETIKQLTIRMDELATKGNAASNEIKATGAAAQSSASAWTILRTEYKEATKAVEEMAAQFGVQSKEAQDAALKLQDLKAQMKEINDLKSKGPAPTVDNVQFIDKTQIEDAKQSVSELGAIVSETERKEQEAIIAAIEWGRAHKAAGDEAKGVKDSVEQTLTGIEKYTGSLKTNVRMQLENQAALKANKEEQKAIVQAIELSGSASESQEKRLISLREETVLLQETNKQLGTTIRNQTKEYISGAGSMEQLQAQINLLQQAYSQLSEAERATPFGRELKQEIDQLEPKIKDLEGTIGKFQRNVGNYPNAILGAFKELGLDDILKKETDNIQTQLKNLQEESKRLAEEYKKSSKAGKDSFQEVQVQLKENLEEQEKLKQSLGNLDNALQRSGGIGQEITKGIADGFRNAKTQVTQLLAGYIGFQAVFSALRSGVGLAKELSDETSNLEIELGKAKGGASGLVSELAKLDTRTKLTGLEQIANIAAKAGVAEDKMLGVVESIDKIKVAFGKDFGEVETGTENLIKLIAIFEGTENVNGDNLLKTGNAIRTLANESTASVPFLTDFAKRMAGLKGTFDVALPDILGLASGFEQFGQSAEVASTSIVKIIPKLAENTEKYAAVAGLTKEAFSDLINNSPIEALLAVSEGLVKGKGSVEEFSEAFADSELGSGRIASVIGVLGSKTDDFRKSMSSATTDYQQTGNITDAFAVKNDNLAAKLDKISKSFADAAGSKAFQITLGAIASVISLLVGNIGILIGVVASYAAIWAVANAQLVIAKVVTLANTVAQTAFAARLVIVTTFQTAYNAAILLFTLRTKIATAATILFGNALRFLPLGAVLTLIGLIAGAYRAFGASVAGTTSALGKQALADQRDNEVKKQATLIYSEQISKIDSWILVITSATSKIDTQKKAVGELTKINSAFGDVIKDNAIDLVKLGQVYDQVTTSIINQANAQASASLTAQKQQKVVQLTMARQIIEETLSKGDFYQVTGDSDLPEEILNIIKKTKGVQLTRNLDLSQDIVVTQKNQKQVLEDLSRQEEAAQKEFHIYNEKKNENESKLNNYLASQVKDTKEYQVDIQKLKSLIEGLDKEINSFKGDNAGLAKKVAERKKLQDRLNELMGGGAKGTGNRGSRLTGDQKDAIRDIEAARDEQIAIEKIKFSQLETTEEEHLKVILKLNLDTANQKLALLKGSNATEKKEIAELKLYKINEQIETNKALFELAKKELDLRLGVDKKQVQNKYESITSDPTKTEQDKRRAKEDSLTQELIIQVDYNEKLADLEKTYGQRRKEDEQKRNDIIFDLQKEFHQNEKGIILGALEDIDKLTDDQIASIKLKYAKIREEILNSNKSADDKKNAISIIDKTENVEIKTAQLNGYREALDYAEQLLKLGLITDQQFQEIYSKAVGGQQALNNAIEEGKEKITSMKGLLTNALSGLFGFEEGSQKAQLLTTTIATAFDTAGAAMNHYYDAEANRIQRSNELNKQKLDIQLEQAKGQAQSQEEIESLDRQFAARKDAEDRKAFEKNKKLQLEQAKINLAIQLSNLAVVAFAPNPANIATLGIAGSIMYAVQAAMAVASYAMNVSKIRSASYDKGGFTGPGIKKDNTGHKVAGVVHDHEWVSPKWMVEHPKYGTVIHELETVRKKGFAAGGFTSTMAYPGKNFDRLQPPQNPASFLTNNQTSNKAEIQEMKRTLTDFSKTVIRSMEETNNFVKETAGTVREVSRQTNTRIDKLKVINVAKETETVNNKLKKASNIGTL